MTIAEAIQNALVAAARAVATAFQAATRNPITGGAVAVAQNVGRAVAPVAHVLARGITWTAGVAVDFVVLSMLAKFWSVTWHSMGWLTKFLFGTVTLQSLWGTGWRSAVAA